MEIFTAGKPYDTLVTFCKKKHPGLVRESNLATPGSHALPPVITLVASHNASSTLTARPTLVGTA